MKQSKTSHMMKRLTAFSILALITMVFIPRQSTQACSRILYETGNGTYITGRSLDWNDPAAPTALWVFPKGLQRDGGAGKNPIKWTSKYGSIGVSIYDAGVTDGMNEKGLAGNTLYLVESDYGDPAKSSKPTISIGAWLPYVLDNFATVEEAVAFFSKDPVAVVAPILPNGRPAVQHFSLSDASGDSAIIEYLGGKPIIHHGRQYQVMTNSPTFDQQLALNVYWDQIGGSKFLPGTIYAADRFVRLSYNLKSSPKYKDDRWAVAAVFSQIRAIGVPLGMEDKDHPNISMTLWRSVADHGARVYYFESALMPALLWVNLNKVDFNRDAGVRKLAIEPVTTPIGDVSAKFESAKDLTWMK